MNNELYHYGVLGMKWGVRRGRKNSSGIRRQSKKLPDHDDYTRAHTKKSVRQMSDAELRTTNNRLQMEKQYSQLTKKETSAGKKFAKGILTAAATSVATAYTIKYMNKGMDYVIDSIAKK